jgi:hypothetical protein
LSSPILVNSSNQIFAGAFGEFNPSLADFNGISFDNTIHEIPSNPPCKIIFNGVLIKDCTHPIPPPVPPAPPSGFTEEDFFFAGVYSSFFNLSNDFYFYSDFLDENYIHEQTMYVRTGTPSTNE